MTIREILIESYLAEGFDSFMAGAHAARFIRALKLSPAGTTWFVRRANGQMIGIKHGASK